MMAAIVTTFGFSSPPDKVGQMLGGIGEGRTVGYAAHGAAGMLTLFIRGMLCNWMVSAGVVGAMISTTVTGKVIAMWMPIMLFFYMTFEHSIVNMFLFPSGLLLGGKFTMLDYIFWNEIPTVVGNLVGGLAFTGLTLYATHLRTAPKRVAATDRRSDMMRDASASVSSGRRPFSLRRDGCDAARTEDLGRAAFRQRPQGDQSGLPRRPDSRASRCSA